MDISFQYPPELLKLLSETIPKLSKSKKDLLLFFRGAGIDWGHLAKYETLLQSDKATFNKYHVTSEILATLNESGDKTLAQRREILKRVTQFDDFSVCWESDQAAARGLVAQVRELVNVKDSFTRMNMERQQERQARIDASQRELEEQHKRKAELDVIRRDFFGLFSEKNPWKRGKAVEVVLNKYFAHFGVLITEAITVRGDAGAGIVEQIDGVIEIRGQLYLVEIKWEQETLGRDKVAPHLVRVFSRGVAGGIIISYSDFSPAAVTDCKEALREKIIVLCKLEELVRAIDRETDLKALLHSKIDAAIIQKNPFLVS
jgi:restriction system protein